MKISPDRRSGMTLLEMLLAVALTGIILGGAYDLMISANEISRGHQQAAMAGRRGWQTLEQMSRELRAAIPPASDGETNFSARDATLPAQPALEVSGSTEFPADFRSGTIPADTIRFTTTAAAQPAPAVVEYALQRNKSGHVIGLSRLHVPAGKKEEDCSPTMQNPSVMAVDCEFMNGTGTWQPAWEAGGLPEAVRVTLWLRTSPPGDLLKVRPLRTVVHLPVGKEVQL